MNDGYGENQKPMDYQQPRQGGNGGQGMAIESMVLGIVSVVLCCIWYISLICAIAGIVFGILNNRNNGRNGMATAGIVCSIIGIVLSIAILILAAVGLMMFSEVAGLEGYLQ